MATDATGFYKKPSFVNLELLNGTSRRKQKFFLTIAPSLIQSWEEIEQTPTTREMLEILRKTVSIIEKKLHHDKHTQAELPSLLKNET